MSIKPLVELHLHLDGSLRPYTMLELARDADVTLPGRNEAELRAALQCGQIRKSLADYLTHFEHTVSVMQTYKALYRIAFELMEDVPKDGVKYVEVRFMPWLHMQRGMSGDFVMGAVLDGLHYGGKAHGVAWGLIVCSMRHVDPDITRQMIDLAIRYRNHGIVAVDLAGDDNLPALEHAAHYRRAKEAGLHVTIHAAEAGPPERVVEAVEHFGAERIGHGHQAVKDPRMVEYLWRHGVGIEASLTSNIQTMTATDYATHPARHCLDFGSLVSINTDNRLLADTTMMRELEMVRQAWSLDDMMMKRLVWNAIYMSFAPKELKDALYEELRTA